MNRDHRAIARLEQRAAIIAVAVSLALMLTKFAAYFLTRSAVIFSDATESIANVLAAAVALAALRMAHTPADTEHPYGHGKIEFVSAAFEGGLICAAAILIAAKGVDQLLTSRLDVSNLGPGLLLIGATVAVNGPLGWYLLALSRRTGSMTLEADGKHLLTDALTSAGTIASLLAVRATGALWLDPVIAIAFGAYVGWHGVVLVRKALAGLTDEQDPKDQQAILAILDAHVGPNGKEPRTCSYHKVRHRHSGRYHWVDLHLRFPATTDVRSAHDAATRIEEEIESLLGEGNATAHVEPCGEEACGLCAERRFTA